MNKTLLYNALTITFTITLLYGYIYSQIKEDFGFTEDPLDPYYFSLMNMRTVAYGDFSPKTQRAKVIVMSQHTIILAEIATIISKIILN